MAAVVTPTPVRAAQNSSQDFLDPHNTALGRRRRPGFVGQQRGRSYALVHSGGLYGENLFWGSSGAD
ncbi:hypothetical protein EJB05_14429, partial [Eragrostis curvula]